MKFGVKLTLRQKEYVCGAVLIAGILLMLSGGWFWPLGLAVGLAAVTMWNAWHRCPSCGKHLGRNGFPNFCPHCGKEIDYDRKL